MDVPTPVIIDIAGEFNPTELAFSEPSTSYYRMEAWWWNYYTSNDSLLHPSIYDFLRRVSWVLR